MEIGERIKNFRVQKRLSQVDFAKMIGCSDALISQIERGTRRPSRNFLINLNKAFRISSDYVLYGNPPDQEEPGLVEHPEGYVREKKEVMTIHEPESKYQILPTATKKLLDNVSEILESGNEVMIDALKANIKAFLMAVRTNKKNDEDKSEGGT